MLYSKKVKNIMSVNVFANTPFQKRNMFNIFKWYKENAKTPGQLRVKKDLQRGNLWEFHEIVKAKDGGVEPSLVRPRLLLPKTLLVGTNLIGEKVHLQKELEKKGCSLIIISQKRIMTEFMVNSWRNPFQEKFPDAQVFEILIPQNFGYSALNPFVHLRVRLKLSQEDRKRMIYPDKRMQINLDPVVLGVNIENSFLSYVFLVDFKGVIIWKAAGVAKPEWLLDMTRVYEKVLNYKEPSYDKYYFDQLEMARSSQLSPVE